MQIRTLIIFLLLVNLAYSSDSLNTAKKVKDPTTALALSIVPGGGQIYNESYIKAGLLLGGTATVISSFIFYNNRYGDAIQDLNELEDESELRSAYVRRREFYRDSRDKMGFYMLILYLIASVDAYTGAKLFDFDIEDDLSFYTNYQNGILRAGIQLKFR